jgi:hypothetical protein
MLRLTAPMAVSSVALVKWLEAANVQGSLPLLTHHTDWLMISVALCTAVNFSTLAC